METLEIQRLGRKITGLGDNYYSCVMWHRNSIAFLIVVAWLSFRSANLNFYSTVPAEIWCLYSDNDCDGNEMGSWHLDANSSWKIVKTLPKRIRRLRPQLLGPNFFWNYLLEQLDDQTMALIFFPLRCGQNIAIDQSNSWKSDHAHFSKTPFSDVLGEFWPRIM